MIRAVLRLSVFFRVGRAWPARLFLKSVHFESAHSADKSSANKHSFLSPYHMCAILRDLASHYIGTRDCEPPRIEKTILDSSLSTHPSTLDLHPGFYVVAQSRELEVNDSSLLLKYKPSNSGVAQKLLSALYRYVSSRDD
jgi:hypothetical protein